MFQKCFVKYLGILSPSLSVPIWNNQQGCDSFNILSTYHLWITACTINIFNHIMFLENRPYNHLCTNQMALVYRMNLRATDN